MSPSSKALSTTPDDGVQFVIHGARAFREREIRSAYAEWLEPLEDATGSMVHAEVIEATHAAYAAAVHLADARLARTEAAEHARSVHARVHAAGG